jgi:Protein of unknown function (DUF4012)
MNLPSPTGQPLFDLVLVAGLVVGGFLVARRARVWTVFVVALVVLVVDITSLANAPIAAAIVAVVLCELIGRSLGSIANDVARAVLMVLLMQLQPIGPFGGSAVVAGLCLVALVLGGSRSSSAIRRRLPVVVAGAVVVVGVGCVAAAATALWARGPLGRSTESMRQAAKAIERKDIDGALVLLASAQADAGRACDRMDSPLGLPARLVPVVAQHHLLGRQLCGDLVEVTDSAVETASILTSGALTVTGGAIDATQLESLSVRSRNLVGATSQLQDRLADLDNRWILPPVSNRLDRAANGQITRAADAATSLADLADQLPGLLGVDRPRRYFVGFMTPAEARPGGGYIGNFAELTMSGGKMTVSRFGRTMELVDATALPETRVLVGPADYLDRYAAFGSGRGVEPATPRWWQTVNISPNNEAVSEVIRGLYRSAGLGELDGVFMIDPVGLAALVEATGPITVPSIDKTLDAQNLTDFLLRGQYKTFSGDREGRVDLLEEISLITLSQFVNAPDLDLADLVVELSGAARGRHVMGWSADADEQRVLRDLGVAGDFAAPTDAGDGFALTGLNAGGNKLDAFLRRKVSYAAVVDQSTGSLTATLTVELTNNAPVDGLPVTVIGNLVGDADGTNRTYLTMYTPHQVESVMIDGVVQEFTAGTEFGWQFAERQLVIPAGATVLVRYQLAGMVAAGDVADYTLAIEAMAHAGTDKLAIDVTSTNGKVLVSYLGGFDCRCEFAEAD